jgi:hypothetical protein
MPSTLEEHAIERSTFVITASFFDESATPVAATVTGTWKLTDYSGNVINSRSAEAFGPATTLNIVLTDEDLIGVAETPLRRITIEGTYDSSLGNDLSLRDQVTFTVDNLDQVT